MTTENEYVRNERVETHEDICRELNTMYATKNDDYGNSYSKIRQEDGIQQFLIFAKTKLHRIESLAKKDSQQTYESIVDSIRDLANYCIMEEVEMHMQNCAEPTPRTLWERSELNDSNY